MADKERMGEMSIREAAQQVLEALEKLDEQELATGDIVWLGKEIGDLRVALADTQDWDEIEALRASLREHMDEIKRLRAAGRQALEALEEHRTVRLHDNDYLGVCAWCYVDSCDPCDEKCTSNNALTALRAALAEDAMQRLTDVQQEMEAVTDSHEKEGGKLSPPLHVGYRYQSPVGGWEYGDHIPAGFDTGKWAHQKIYILQEQS